VAAPLPYRPSVALVAVVEDDARLRDAVVRSLRERGHEVVAAETGVTGIQVVTERRPDIVVLDLGLPDVDGREVLRMVRAVSDVPVLVATARDEEAEVVDTLDAGADDYVVKPFSGHQLDARIRAVLRRARPGDEDDRVVVGSLVVDAGRRTAVIDGRPLDLSRKEFDLLHALACRAGRVVTKRQLMAEVWDQPWGGADKTVDVHLSWLRRKLGESAAEPRFLHTVRGVGVKLAAPSDPPAG
jgi:two-component system KDP operon response regulator KdpE